MITLISFLLGSGLVVGQLWRIPLFGQSLPWLDLAVGLTVLLAVITVHRQRLWSQVVKSPAFYPLAVWVAAWLGSLVVGLPRLDSSELLTSSFYWVRLCGYALCALLVSIAWPKLLRSHWHWLSLFAIFLMAGFAQFLLFPDFQIFEHLGWDPHQNRFMGSFLDPNFAAIWLSFGFALAGIAITRKNNLPTNLALIGIGLGLVGGLVLTASRSGLIALAASLATIGLWRSPRLAVVVLGVATLSLFFIPTLNAKIAGALQLDTTTRYRLESWEAGLNLARQQPILGVGYNTLSATRYQAALPGTAVLLSQFGNQLGSPLIASHATTGFDSSLLTILATTGFVGLSVFLWVIYHGVRSAWITRRSLPADHPDHLRAVWFISITIALLASAWFVNAWLYPPVLLTWLLVYTSLSPTRNDK